jgi:hypothetical protein
MYQYAGCIFRLFFYGRLYIVMIIDRSVGAFVVTFARLTSYYVYSTVGRDLGIVPLIMNTICACHLRPQSQYLSVFVSKYTYNR